MAGVNLGKVGVWALELRFGDKAEGEEATAELDELGYGALWVPGGIDGAVLDDVSRLLDACPRMAIATGIINIWKHEPAAVAAWFAALDAGRQARVMLGLGVSHGPLIGDAWAKPLAVMRAFLGGLEGAGMAMDHTCLAALGPKMVELSGARTAGAHPYLATPEHTAQAREILGPGKLLAPEQGVVLERDPVKAREIARSGLTNYLGLPNYRSNWIRLGFTEDDCDTASDRLVDALVAWGGPEEIAQRVKAHHDAGADHVCIQLIRGPMGGDIAGLRAACRELACVLV